VAMIVANSNSNSNNKPTMTIEAMTMATINHLFTEHLGISDSKYPVTDPQDGYAVETESGIAIKLGLMSFDQMSDFKYYKATVGTVPNVRSYSGYVSL